MTEPITLQRAPSPTDPDVVRFLEETLERAKSGELLAIAFAAELTGGETSYCWAGPMSPIRMMGILEWLKIRLWMAKADPDELRPPGGE